MYAGLQIHIHLLSRLTVWGELRRLLSIRSNRRRALEIFCRTVNDDVLYKVGLSAVFPVMDKKPNWSFSNQVVFHASE